MERTVEFPRGSERNFASEGQIVEKFNKLAVHALPSERAAALRDAMLGLEKEGDVRRIVGLMAGTR
jgi:hypothetical protein